MSFFFLDNNLKSGSSSMYKDVQYIITYNIETLETIYISL